MKQELTTEEQQELEHLKKLVSSPDIIDVTEALNILIMCSQIAYDSCDKFNEFDKMLIIKALECFSDKVASGQDFTVKVN